MLRRFLALFLLALLAACGTTAVDIGYTPPTATVAAAGTPIVEIVEIGEFSDQRGEPSTWLGAIRGGFGNPLKTLETSKPVANVVTDAFADGLAARGLLAPTGNGAYRLAGTIRAYDCNQVVRREANTDFDVSLIETATGRTVVSRPVKRSVVTGSIVSLQTGVFASVEDLRAVAAQVLRESVDEVLDSDAVRAALR